MRASPLAIQDAPRYAARGARSQFRLIADLWPGAALLLGSLLVVVWTVQSASWVEGLSLYRVVVLAVLAGLASALVSPSRRVLMHFAAASTGVALVYWHLAILADAGPAEAVGEIGRRMELWWRVVTSGGFTTESMPFAIGFLVAAWTIAYVSAWATFARRNPWLGVVPGALALLTVLAYLPDQYSLHLFLYMGTVLLLVVWHQGLAQKCSWERSGIAAKGFSQVSGLRRGAWFALVVIVVAAAIPVRSPTLGAFEAGWEWLRTPVTSLEDQINRVFVALPSRTNSTGYLPFGDYLAFEGPLFLDDDPYFVVVADAPVYLRARSYPVYTSGGWSTGGTQEIGVLLAPSSGPTGESASARPFEYTVTPLVRAKDLPFAGSPIEASTDVMVLTPTPKRFRLSLADDPLEGDPLPEQLRAAASHFRQEQDLRIRVALDPGFLPRTLPQDVAVSRLVLKANDQGEEIVEAGGRDLDLAALLATRQGRIVWIEVVRDSPTPPDTLGLTGGRTSKPGEPYRLRSMLANATPAGLRRAGTQYPGWVTDSYLQLPETLPQRVLELALAVGRDKPTPYDKALAVATYLGDIPYDQSIPAPAGGADGVDHFLFEVGRGYSQYFGSAMAVLMRANGVPARLAVGYLPGDRNPDLGAWIVREQHRHGWAEVYFPGHGWVDFDATPRGQFAGSAGAGNAPVTPIGVDSEAEGDPFADEEDAPLAGSRTPTLTAGTLRAWLVGVSLAGLIAVAALGYLYWAKFVLAGSVAVVFGRMRLLGALAGAPPRAHETPREYGRRLSQAAPRVAEDIRFLSEAFSKVAYGRREPADEESALLSGAWSRVRRALIRGLWRRTHV